MSYLQQLLTQETELPIFIFKEDEVRTRGYYPIAKNSAEVKELTFYEGEWLDKEQCKDRILFKLAFEGLTEKLLTEKLNELEFIKALVIYESEDDVI